MSLKVFVTDIPSQAIRSFPVLFVSQIILRSRLTHSFESALLSRCDMRDVQLKTAQGRVGVLRIAETRDYFTLQQKSNTIQEEMATDAEPSLATCGQTTEPDSGLRRRSSRLQLNKSGAHVFLILFLIQATRRTWLLNPSVCPLGAQTLL